MIKKEQYYLFIDECGDQNLSNFDKGFPIFTLCGIIVSEDKKKYLDNSIEELKREFWGEKKVILHSRDIRKCQNGFEILFDLEVKKKFYERVNTILGEKGIYTIVCCSILKEPYIRQYGKLNDVYAQSLSFLMERTVFYLDSVSIDQNTLLDITVEMRGKKEDKNLREYFMQLMEKGTYWVNPDRLKKYVHQFDFKPKKANISCLQIADLIAYPITRHILDPESVNFAYDILKDNIFTENAKLLGLKIIPKD